MPKSISQSLQETRERLKLLKEVQEEEMNREEIKTEEAKLSAQAKTMLEEQLKKTQKYKIDGIGRKVGRPSKLSEENIETIKELSRDYIQSATHNDNLVSRAGLCVWLGTTRTSLQRWEEKSSEFRVILDDIDVIGENQLAENSKNGTWNALFCKFMLSAKYHYREKSDITSDNKGFDSFMLAHKENEEKEA